MPSDAVMLARLNMMADPGCRGNALLSGDITTICWAIERIGKLKRALCGADYGPMQRDLAELLERAAECHETMCAEFQCDSTIARPLRQEAASIRAALAPHKAATCQKCKGTRFVDAPTPPGKLLPRITRCPDCAGKAEVGA